MSTIDQQADEIARLKVELAQVRAEARAGLAQCGHMLDEARVGNALITHALDCALIWGEALFAFLPEGMVLPEGVKTAKGALTEAMRALQGIRRDDRTGTQ
jgi:hypothetical protein